MSEHNKTVLVDMDGVMADFDTAALLSTPEDIRVVRSNFYVADDYSEEYANLIKATYNDPKFFESLDAMPGLIEGWQTLLDNGYHPRIASAPLSSNPASVEGKIKWLDRVMVPEFGPRVTEEAIFDKNKWKYSGLALIDDRPDVPRGEETSDGADWEHILYGWAHMSEVPMSTAAYRLLSWRDTDSLLSSLALIEFRNQ